MSTGVAMAVEPHTMTLAERVEELETTCRTQQNELNQLQQCVSQLQNLTKDLIHQTGGSCPEFSVITPEALR